MEYPAEETFTAQAGTELSNGANLVICVVFDPLAGLCLQYSPAQARPGTYSPPWVAEVIRPKIVFFPALFCVPLCLSGGATLNIRANSNRNRFNSARISRTCRFAASVGVIMEL
jgi:hypothetical protein